MAQIFGTAKFGRGRNRLSGFLESLGQIIMGLRIRWL
jgi:hypothetical protein